MDKIVFLTFFLASLSGCPGAQRGTGGPVASARNGESRLHFDPPDGWVRVPPDDSVAPDTVIILQGPTGDSAVAPVVEVSHRTLSAADRRRRPEHVVTALVAEVAQLFESFETRSGPEEVVVGGKPATLLRVHYSETLPAGVSEPRLARFYGLVDQGDIWLLRCIGPSDGSAEPVFDAIVRSASWR